VFRNEAEHVKFPRDIEDAKKLGEVLSRYKEKYYFQVINSLPKSLPHFKKALSFAF